MLTLIWVVALLAAFVMYCNKVSSRFHKRGAKCADLFTTLKALMALVMGWQHSTDIIYKSYNESLEERFIATYFFGWAVLHVHDLDLIKKVTVKDFEHFTDHRNIGAGDPLFARNIVSLSGEEWKEMRSNLTPGFTSSKLKLMMPFMVDVGDQMVLSLKKTIKESDSEYLELNVKDIATRYANDVIASCAFGLKVNSLSDRKNEFYTRGLETATFKLQQIVGFMISVSFPRFTKMLKLKMFTTKSHHFFTNLVLSSIENREINKIFRPDMINTLMEVKKVKLEDKEQTQGADAGFATVEEPVNGKRKIQNKWDDVDLVAQAVIFFLAGFESISTVMSFLLYELAVNPDIQDRLLQEIKETDEKTGGNVDYNAIQQMTYMDMVVSETMRKWPPVTVLDRLCVKDYNLGRPNDKAKKDFIIRKGEGLEIPLWGIQRNPEYFPDPLKFIPERFSDENKHNIKPFTYLPFGIGPRNCIAIRFSITEVKVMAYQLLQHIEVSPGPRTTITSQLEPSKMNINIKGGHWIRFKIRN